MNPDLAVILALLVLAAALTVGIHASPRMLVVHRRAAQSARQAQRREVHWRTADGLLAAAEASAEACDQDTEALLRAAYREEIELARLHQAASDRLLRKLS